MLTNVLHLIDGFWAWQTPLSFLAGVGAHHLYCKYFRDRKKLRPMMFSRKHHTDSDDDEYRFSTRFWVVVCIAAALIGVIGWRTQDTSDKVHAQAEYNTAVAEQTNKCLNEVLAALKERVGYNDQVSELRTKRDDIWMTMIVALAAINTHQPQELRDAQAKVVLDKFLEDNKALDKARADALANRNEVPYPPENCGEVKPER